MFFTTILIIVLAIREYQFWRTRKRVENLAILANEYADLLESGARSFGPYDNYDLPPKGKTLLRG